MKNFNILYVILIVIISCQPDDDILEPTIESVTAQSNQSIGVILSGSYSNSGLEISEKGFEVSFRVLALVNGNKSTIIDRESDEGKLEIQIPTGLEKNTEYFYRGFVKVGNKIFYSEIKSFISRGSIPPEISSYSPQFAHLADIVEIRGKHFTDINFLTFVFYNDIKSNIISLSDSLIRTTVPISMSEHKDININVKLYDRETTIGGFNLYAPIINTIEPSIASFGDEITIKGDHFDTEKLRNRVFFGKVKGSSDSEIEGIISYSDRNEIKVIVPNGIETNESSILVKSQNQSVISADNFKIKEHVILTIPNSVKTLDEITITGRFFNPDFSKNIVKFEGVKAEILSGGKDFLNVKVPIGPYPRRKAKVTVQVSDLVNEYENDIDILDEWINVNDDLPFRFYGSVKNSVVANNKAYILTFSKDIFDNIIYLWEMNEDDFSWEKKEIPFLVNSTGVAVSNGNKIYVYTANANNEFWEYDTITNTWKQLPDFIGDRRRGATHFSIGNDLYIGLGADFEPYTNIELIEFYKFSPSTNSWTRIADFTYQSYFQRIETASFVINGVAYFGNGATNTGMVDFWSYEPVSNQWVRIADFPDARGGTAGFSLNGFGYITGGNPVGGSNSNDCWRYSPTTNEWVKVNFIGNIPRSGHFSFVLNGKGYIGGGSNGYDMYQFVPN